MSYDNEHAITLYYYRCNLMCPDCDQKHLMNNPNNLIPEGYMEILKREIVKDRHTAIVHRGGEPTQYIIDTTCNYINIQFPCMKQKLFTNGINHERILKTIPFLNAINLKVFASKNNHCNMNIITGSTKLDLDTRSYIENIEAIIDKAIKFGLDIEVSIPKGAEPFSQDILKWLVKKYRQEQIKYIIEGENKITKNDAKYLLYLGYPRPFL